MICVDVRELENGALDQNIVLQDGDTVFVRKAQAVTITGHVRNVGAYTVESGSTVEQALALAGGFTERGSPKRIEITRKVDGQDGHAQRRQDDRHREARRHHQSRSRDLYGRRLHKD